jgi:hypothetical protein
MIILCQAEDRARSTRRLGKEWQNWQQFKGRGVRVKLWMMQKIYGMINTSSKPSSTICIKKRNAAAAQLDTRDEEDEGRVSVAFG